MITKGRSCNKIPPDSVWEHIAFYPVFLLSGYTILYHCGLIAGLSFSTLTWSAVGLFIFISTIWAWRISHVPDGYFGSPTLDSGRFARVDKIVIGLVGLCLLASGISLLSIIPNKDDVHYFGPAVFSVEHAQTPLRWRYPFFGMPDTGHFSLDAFQSYPFLVASAADALGIDSLAFYHMVMPVLGAMGVTLAWFTLIQRMTENRTAALLGTFVLVGLLATDGMTHRSVASFGLYRIWQGKVLLMQVLTPLVILATLNVLKRGTCRDWLRIVGLSVAGIGLSSTAQFFLPILAGLVGFSHVAVNRVPRMLPKVFGVAFVLGLYALPLTVATMLLTPMNDEYFRDIASSLGQILAVVYHWPYSISLAMFTVALIVILIAKEWLVFAWLTIWTAFLVIPLAFEPIAILAVNYMTTSNAFWRLAYTSPVLLTIGLGVAVAFKRDRLRAITLMAVALLSTGAVALALAPSLPGIPAGISPLSSARTRFPVIDYKLHEEAQRISKELIESLPSGTMLAAKELACTLPLFSGKFRQAAFRELDAPSLMRAEGMRAQSGVLLSAFKFVNGEQLGRNFEGFVHYLPIGPDYIVITDAALSYAASESHFERAGYHQLTGDWGKYSVFTRNLSLPEIMLPSAMKQ